MPDAEVQLLDAGHFALKTHAAEIADMILEFLGHKLKAWGKLLKPRGGR
jgi:hypothetical protein